jgi:hypothetical protein
VNTVEFDLIGNSETAPRVRGWVDGVKVIWRAREGHPGLPPFIGWICEDHGKGRCEHTDVAEDHLTENLANRLVRLEERAGRRRSA